MKQLQLKQPAARSKSVHHYDQQLLTLDQQMTVTKTLLEQAAQRIENRSATISSYYHKQYPK